MENIQKQSKIEFCDYIKLIKETFNKGDTYIFVKKQMRDINLISNIMTKKVITFEISQNRWEEVEWDINDTDIIYPIDFKILFKKIG